MFTQIAPLVFLVLVFIIVGPVIGERFDRWAVLLGALGSMAVAGTVTVAALLSDRHSKELLLYPATKAFSTVSQFYGALSHGLSTAETTLDVTHIRDNPPVDFGESAAEYADGVLRWLAESSSRSARRVIAVRNDRMRRWAQDLRSIQEQTPNLHVRVVDWNLAAPALNLAILDSKVVFMSVTGETVERTRGVLIEDETVAQYFADYYDALWASSTPLELFLAESTARGTDSV